MDMKNPVDLIAMILVVIGSLNVGLGAIGFDVLNMIFGSIAILEQIIYILVGLAGLYMIYAAWLKK